MSDPSTAALAPHGTPERWQADCDCADCRWAMQDMFGDSELTYNSKAVLECLLHFRVHGCELCVVPAMIEAKSHFCRATVRRHIDDLVSFGALSKIAPVEGRSGRSGIYLLHLEKLTVRPDLKLYKEFSRLSEDEGMSKASAWRMMMLKDHEMCGGNPCSRCGNFSVADGGYCAHCHVIKYQAGIRCPVCQEIEIPKVFFDPKMQSELERVETARAKFFQPRRLMLVKN
jgi:hypothetical protein